MKTSKKREVDNPNSGLQKGRQVVTLKVLGWIREGLSRMEILQKLQEELEYSYVASVGYYTRASEELRISIEEDLEIESGKILETYYTLYQKCVTYKEFGVAAKVLENISKLRGLYDDRVRVDAEIQVKF